MNEVHKIMMLGDSAVGKTSLLLRFSDNIFSETYISTIGIDFKLKTVEIDGTPIRIQCWQFTIGFVVVYDITNETSFNNIENWLHGISEAVTKEYSSILIGNKLDLADNHRTISTYKGDQLAKKYNMKYIETSALTDTNVEEAFVCLAKIIHAKRANPKAVEKPSIDKVHLNGKIRLNSSLNSSVSSCC
ncbi:hypothetical protein HZS_6773 [Henneguya salminicola]|nr:hypothetical protein HZS_6773 [Henneguya salminicola]